MLLDGKVCRKYGCSKCCYNTEMPLTLEDIKRIVSLGYKPEEFTVFVDGYWRLKNKDGHCVFLVNGKCSIYPYRPEGCRYYPVVELDGKCTLDFEICPYAHLISAGEFEWACKKVLEFNRKLDQEAKTKEYKELRLT